jgi:hypothetical protein
MFKHFTQYLFLTPLQDISKLEGKFVLLWSMFLINYLKYG